MINHIFYVKANGYFWYMAKVKIILFCFVNAEFYRVV